jgi:hypothetical protein
MFWKRRRGIEPYGYDWNGDRSSPDYDPRRDPWLPGSPVHGQYPRRPWLRQAAKAPLFWVFVAWFAITFGLMGVYAVGAISRDALFVGWAGRYVVLFAGLTTAGVWSLVAWLRKTPRGERGSALRQKLKEAPYVVASVIGVAAVCVALEAIEKRYGVPLLVSFGGLFAVCMGVIWWRDRARQPEGAGGRGQK